MWNEDELEGKADQVKGRIKDAAGNLTGDEQMEREGEADKIGGTVQDTIGKGRRKAGETMEDLGENLKR